MISRERIIAKAGSRVTAVFLLGLAVALSGCSNGEKYDTKTETALEKVIDPTMQKYGKQILRFANQNSNASYVSVGTNDVSVSVSGEQPFGDDKHYARLDVVTERLGNSPKPNPNKILAVSMSSSYDGPQQTSTGSLVMYSPYKGQPVLSFGGHKEGWTAQMSGQAGVEGAEPYFFDTSDKNSFVAKENDSFAPSDPVTTAKYIVSHAGDELQLIQSMIDSSTR